MPPIVANREDTCGHGTEPQCDFVDERR